MNAHIASSRATPFARLAALLCLLAMVAVEGAAADQGLDEALVPVADTSEATRLKALPMALSQIFSKRSGQRSLSAPGMAAELARASEFVQQFRYRDVGDGDGSAPMLWVRFDPEAVARSVRRAGIPIWSAQRPSPLLWVAFRDGEELDLVGPDSERGFDRALLDAAWRRAIPLRLPLLDLEDRIQIKPQDVWAMNDSVLQRASARYPAGPMVSARLEADAQGAWQASWRMRDSGQTRQWQTRGQSPAAALSAGVDEIADHLVARYALSDTDAQEVEFEVAGVRSLADYGRLMSYLRSLTSVSDVAVVETRGEHMRLRVNVAGGADGLQRSVEFGGVLIANVAGSGYRLGP